MADIVVTAAKVQRASPAQYSEINTYVAAEAITAGQAVYLTSSGTAGVADANAAGKQQCVGISLTNCGAGSPVDVVSQGIVAGFTLAGAYMSLVYLSDTAGALADTAGTMTVPVGKVVPASDSSATKLLHVMVNWLTTYS